MSSSSLFKILIICFLGGVMTTVSASQLNVMQPSEFSRKFSEAMNAGNIDGLLSLYEEDAAVVTDKKIYFGLVKIKENLINFKSLNGVLSSSDVYVIEKENLALVRVNWLIHSKDSPRKILAQGEIIEVLKKVAGRWVYAIDHPFGASDIINAVID